MVKDTEASIFAIGLGTKVDHGPLEQIARMSAGEAYFPEQAAGLRDEYRRIIENLRRRYVVSYTSTNSSRDGGWRDVKIRSRSWRSL